MNDMVIGRNIKELRLHREMDADRFARSCDVELSVVAQWENDELTPTSQELYKIAKVLRVDMEYFFEEIGESCVDLGYHSECCDNVISALCLLSEIPTANVPRRKLLWRMLREELLRYKLKKFDVPQFTVKYTTERQRGELVASFEDLFGDEYHEIIEGYIKGENELSLLDDEILERGDLHRQKERNERDKRADNVTWKAYRECIKYLSSALCNEFTDLRYADVAVEKLGKYLTEHQEGINDSVLQLLYNEMKVSVEKGDEDNLRKVYMFLCKYEEALWSQLSEEDRIQLHI